MRRSHVGRSLPIAIALGVLFSAGAGRLAMTSNAVQVSFIDVGQGDSILLRDGNGFDVLIDGGKTSAGPDACSAPPAGHTRWTLALLADRVVLLGLAERISRETVRRVLQETTANPGSSRSGAFPK